MAILGRDWSDVLRQPGFELLPLFQSDIIYNGKSFFIMLTDINT